MAVSPWQFLLNSMAPPPVIEQVSTSEINSPQILKTELESSDEDALSDVSESSKSQIKEKQKILHVKIKKFVLVEGE